MKLMLVVFSAVLMGFLKPIQLLADFNKPGPVLRPIRMANAKIRIFKPATRIYRKENISGTIRPAREVCAFSVPIGVYSFPIGSFQGAPEIPACETELNHDRAVIRIEALIRYEGEDSSPSKIFSARFKAFQSFNGLVSHEGRIDAKTSDLNLRNLSFQVKDEARITPSGYLPDVTDYLEMAIEFEDK